MAQSESAPSSNADGFLRPWDQSNDWSATVPEGHYRSFLAQGSDLLISLSLGTKKQNFIVAPHTATPAEIRQITEDRMKAGYVPAGCYVPPTS